MTTRPWRLKQRQRIVLCRGVSNTLTFTTFRLRMPKHGWKQEMSEIASFGVSYLPSPPPLTPLPCPLLPSHTRPFHEHHRAPFTPNSRNVASSFFFHVLFIFFVFSFLCIFNLLFGTKPISPSTKGSDHLTLTWRISEESIVHVDIAESNKSSALALGAKLKVGSQHKESFDDLDHILEAYVNAINRLMAALTASDKFAHGL